MEKKYLSVEEQFKETLNSEEINRIKDPELREIRFKHWQYRTKIFLDESNISDAELCRLIDIDYVREKKELEVYRNQNSI